jgi:hypothetical protein
MKEIYIPLPQDKKLRMDLFYGLLLTGHEVRVKDEWIIFKVATNNIRDVK